MCGKLSIFVYSMLMYFTTLHINYGNVTETMQR